MTEKEQLKEAVKEAIAESRGTVGAETHELHHEFIKDELARRQRRRQMWGHAKKTAVGAVTIAILTVVWHWVEWLGHVVLNIFHSKPQ